MRTTDSGTIEREQQDNLILGISAGDPESLQKLYVLTHSSVYGFALSYVKNEADAEDIMQDTFVRIWQKAGSFHAEGHAISWILQITKNLALEHLRSRKREMTLEPEQWELFEGKNTSLISEDRALLEILFQDLNEEEQRVVILHGAAGLKHREIAALMETPLPTILSRYHRAMKKLKERLKGADYE